MGTTRTRSTSSSSSSSRTWAITTSSSGTIIFESSARRNEWDSTTRTIIFLSTASSTSSTESVTGTTNALQQMPFTMTGFNDYYHQSQPTSNLHQQDNDSGAASILFRIIYIYIYIS